MIQLKKFVVKVIRLILNLVGHSLFYTDNLDIVKYPQDFTEDNITIIQSVEEYTMTTIERVNALIDSVKYLSHHNIEGAFVECGVWKGGSVIAMVKTLNLFNDQSREIYLYDTFSGMPEPSDQDIEIKTGKSVKSRYFKLSSSNGSSTWCYSPLEEVKQNVFNTEYPEHLFKFVVGKVEDTIPKIIPERIALLRLDTDWYSSTKHELEHLYPLLVKNGILIIDDYGHYEGARLAVDEYITENNLKVLLNRVDYSCRIIIKSDP
jgi:hypothetical protein